MTRIVLTFCILIGFIGATAQSSFIPLNHNSEYYLNRIEAKTGRLANDFHTGIYPYNRLAVAKYIQSLDSSEQKNLNLVDKANLGFIADDNWEFIENREEAIHKPLLKYFFKEKNDFLSYKDNDFNIHASPILNLEWGNNSSYGLRESRNISNNTRGVEIRGQINDKLGFYTMLADNVTSPTNYFINYAIQHGGIPYESFVKIIDEDSTRFKMNYFQAIGYLTFTPIKNLQLTFGHDKNFVGHGLRSLALSDFSAPYLNLRMDLRLGRFQYQNIFAQMTNKQIEIVPYSQKTNTPKYLAFHHLNANVTRNLNIGIFEQAVFGNRKLGFDLNYLNPVIFYRFIEGYLGSSDNALVGADFKWNVAKTASVYGQFILDEFNLKEFKNDNWWAKKYGYQIGLKYYDVFKIQNLDFQFEHNRVRPYTYSHFTTFTNYVNYNLPIAHPLGANFKENILILKYQPTQKLELTFTKNVARKGEDYSDSTNYGGDILKNNINREGDYGIKQGQGFQNRIDYLDLKASYMLWHNIYADVQYRRRKDSHNTSGKENIFSFGVRWNFPYRSYMF